MKQIIIYTRCATILLFTLVIASCAQSLALHSSLNSSDYGVGNGVRLEETQRDAVQSRFKIVRTYDYRADRSTAWGLAQSWFTFCAIRDVAAERGASQFTRKYRVLDGDQLRIFKQGEESWDIEPNQFYVLVDWLHGESTDVEKLLNDGIAVTNDPRITKFCADMKTKNRQ